MMVHKYKKSTDSTERGTLGCKFFLPAFWNIHTGPVSLKPSRRSREAA